MEVNEIQSLMAERDEALRQQAVTEQMLAYVLLAVGEPVVVTRDLIAAGIPDSSGISVVTLEDEDALVFSLEIADEQ